VQGALPCKPYLRATGGSRRSAACIQKPSVCTAGNCRIPTVPLHASAKTARCGECLGNLGHPNSRLELPRRDPSIFGYGFSTGAGGLPSRISLFEWLSTLCRLNLLRDLPESTSCSRLDPAAALELLFRYRSKLLPSSRIVLCDSELMNPELVITKSGLAMVAAPCSTSPPASTVTGTPLSEVRLALAAHGRSVDAPRAEDGTFQPHSAWGQKPPAQCRHFHQACRPYSSAA
jgi:hypothetical protein